MTSEVVDVLVVDDHSIVSGAVAHMLETNGPFKVRTATTGSEALALCNSVAPDVVLCDLSLDEAMNGWQLIEKLVPTIPDAHIVVFSSMTEPDAIFDALDAGASGYISKTMNAQKLPEMLLAAAHGEEVYDSETQRVVLAEARKQRRKPETDKNQLTLREKEVLAYLCKEGGSTSEIAKALYLRPNTVATHLQKIYAKLGVQSRAAAVIKAREQKLDRTIHDVR